jgi:glycosyltransferase involved in cell wall biosynthesis
MEKRSILIDVTPLMTNTLSGIGHVTLSLIRALAKRPDIQQNYRIKLLAPRFKAYLLDAWHLEGVEVVRIPLLARIWNVWPRFRFMIPIDLIFGKGIYIFPNFKRWPLMHSPSITFVHDISFKLFPQFTEPRNLAMLRHVPYWIAKSSLIITDSKAAREEIIEAYKLDPAKIVPIYCGVDEALFRSAPTEAVEAVKTKYAITKPYMFFLSNLEPRKNIVRLLQALASLPESYKQTYALVMVGGMSWQNSEIVAEMERLRAKGWTIIKPNTYVPDEDLPALLTGASALVHPALHEGFGIPPVEALACGTRVVASDIPVLREVLGDAAYFVDPHNVAAIAGGIEKALTDPQDPQQVALGKKVAARYTWDAAADELMQYIRKVAV